MKKYKHKSTGIIGSFNAGYYSCIEDGVICHIPAKIVENSDEWKEYVLTTDDGVDLYDGDEYYMLYRNSVCTGGADIHILYDSTVKRFSTEKAAKAYLREQRKPTVDEIVNENLSNEYHFVPGGRAIFPTANIRDLSVLFGKILHLAHYYNSRYEPEEKPCEICMKPDKTLAPSGNYRESYMTTFFTSRETAEAAIGNHPNVFKEYFELKEKMLEL